MREEELNKLFFSKEGTQMAHEKMLNVTNHQGNVNRNQVRYSFIPTRMAIMKRQKITSVGKDGERLEPSFTTGENVK